MSDWQPHLGGGPRRRRWIIRAALLLLIVAGVIFFVRWRQHQTPDYLAARAHEAIAAGDDDKAEIYLQNLVRRSPDDADSRLALAELFVRKARRTGRPASFAVDGRAMQLLTQAAALRPDDSLLQLKLMTACLEGGREEEATKIAQKLVRAGSKDTMALCLVVRKAVADGDYVQAEPPLEHLAAAQPDPPLRVLLLEARVWGALGQKARMTGAWNRPSGRPPRKSPRCRRRSGGRFRRSLRWRCNRRKIRSRPSAARPGRCRSSSR